MANVTIKFNGKEFLLSCDDGQEEHLEELLIQINQKFNNLKNDLGNIGENKLLLITAVKVMDEYHETKKKVEQKKIELKELSNKFRELKSLVYEYRDRKEEEIKNLNKNHIELKDEIEQSQKHYEKLIDTATDEISNFVEKANTDKVSQQNFVNKSQIRKKILKIRKQKKIKKFLFNFNSILKILKKKKVLGKIIGGYYPYNYEIDILQILEKFEKKKFVITLPKIRKNSQMNFFQWSKNDPLAINKFGIPEPISKMIKYPDVLLVPLVAFDKNFNRIGYGGGFYDRYINKIRKRKKVLTIGFAYSFQKVKKIPTNNYDIELDFIITNK